MDKYIKVLIGILCFCGILHTQHSAAQTPVQITQNTYVTDLDVAISLSQDTQQNILLIFSADWCGPCKELKKDLVNFKNLDNKIICILDTDTNKKLARKFGIRSLPTSILLDNELTEYDRIIGYDKELFHRWIESNI